MLRDWIVRDDQQWRLREKDCKFLQGSDPRSRPPWKIFAVRFTILCSKEIGNFVLNCVCFLAEPKSCLLVTGKRNLSFCVVHCSHLIVYLLFSNEKILG